MTHGLLRTKPVDLVFCLDATQSTQNVFRAMRDQAIDTMVDFHMKNRMVDDRYGIVVYRDPVCQAKFRDKDDVNECLDLTKSNEEVEEFLAKVESYGGADEPEDWAGGLDLALHNIHWREGKKCIFWIADANAHGKRFSGLKDDPFDDQVPRLVRLVEEAARNGFYFTAINVRVNGHPGCDQTLRELRKIYEGAGGKNFTVESFDAHYDPDRVVGDGEDATDWGEDVLQAFQQTITATMNRALGGATGAIDVV